MSEGELASAVALPDQENVQRSPEHTAKRRNSSVTDQDSKRRRLSADGDASQSVRAEPESPNERKPAPRVRKEDERKRGQRLFGGLLGTLSQSSNSATQKRRADIEKRQQDKLKNQAEEYDGMKSRRRERRDAIRRKETPFYEREAMQTRHSNMIAAAHFLKTRTEPVLCYKPWQLRERDEEIIAEQIKEAEATVSREVADFEARYPPEAFEYRPEPRINTETPAEHQEMQQQPHQHQQPLSGDQQKHESSNEDPAVVTNQATTKETPENVGNAQDAQKETVRHEDIQQGSAPDEANTSKEETTAHEVTGASAADDDGGEVVEDNEDTVIY